MPFDVAGYVLAGGRSSRMGQDKALLEVEGFSLVQRALELLRPLCTSLTILSGPPVDEARELVLRRLAPTLPDAAREYQGPLAGVAAALEQCASKFAVFVGVDQVGLNTPLLQSLLEASYASGAIPVVASVFAASDGSPEPLPLLAATTLAPLIRAQLFKGERRLLLGVQQAVLHSNGCLKLLAAEPASAAVTLNLNTPVEFSRWRKTLAAATNSSTLRASE